MPDVAEPVAASYAVLAPAYDTLTEGYDYDRWLAEIERVASAHGLTGRRVLDVACGTGKSFLPLLRAGYSVTGCDISPAMLERAAAKAPDVPLHEADMRALPAFGAFDLVTCLDDALNHLLTPDELLAALRGIRRNLAPGGVAVWDTNTLSTYATMFTETHVIAAGETFVVWEGRAEQAAAGMRVEALVHVFGKRSDGAWHRSASRQEQRHWPAEEIAAAAAAAGLRIVCVLGQRTGVVLEPELDEARHTKALYFAVHPEQEGGDGMDLIRP
jgi:2-polyprenyl-3-methyl-5-hydroxy-6-metoxy-1,4-benzoquinol methylase